LSNLATLYWGRPLKSTYIVNSDHTFLKLFLIVLYYVLINKILYGRIILLILNNKYCANIIKWILSVVFALVSKPSRRIFNCSRKLYKNLWILNLKFIHYFWNIRFPKNLIVKRKWLIAINKSFIPRRHHRICLKHFEKESYVKIDGFFVLKKNAIPRYIHRICKNYYYFLICR